MRLFKYPLTMYRRLSIIHNEGPRVDAAIAEVKAAMQADLPVPILWKDAEVGTWGNVTILGTIEEKFTDLETFPVIPATYISADSGINGLTASLVSLFRQTIVLDEILYITAMVECSLPLSAEEIQLLISIGKIEVSTSVRTNVSTLC